MYLKITEIDKDNLNNDILKEYIRYKRKYPDSVLLIQIGSFYEALFEDAKLLSDSTGVLLSSRKFKDIGEIVQSGIPVNSLNAYIKKILNADLKVCVCNQIETAKNKYKRKVVRLYTKGTVVESEFLDSEENNFLLALYCKDEKIYLSYADVSTGQFYKTCGDLNSIKLEVDKIFPNEILIPIQQKEKFKSITEKYNTTFLQAKFFDVDCIENTILKYCSLAQKEFLIQLDNIIEYDIKSTMSIDEISRQNLEISRTRRFFKKKGSLLSLLNHTKTPMGSRLLKKYLNEPLLDIDLISKRLEAVKELIEKQDFCNEILNLLQEFCDLSRVCAKISNTTILPKDLLLIVKNANLLEDIYNTCSKFDSELLKINRNKMLETINLAKKIQNAIIKNPNDDVKSGGIINKGYNPRLDYYRSELDKLNAELSKYEQEKRIEFGIEKLKIGYSPLIGYYLEFPTGKKNFIPENYIIKQNLTSCIRCVNNEISNFEENILKLKYKINDFEYELYNELRKEASEFVQSIRILANEVAVLDVMTSYAECAKNNNFVCPNFNTENKLIIKNGFHPALLKLNNQIVKNDTEIKNGQMIILTGANMSGKSTYIKHNAIICLLAQIGSFVPAGYAACPIVDKIFVRQSVSDDIINNNSSFMVEMDDFKFILENSTSSSLVLLDEPAKSTNADEGGVIARAFLEYLLKYNKPIIFVATHNFEITKSEKSFPDKIFNYMIGGNVLENAILDRKIKRGIAKRSFALSTAQLADLPVEIIRNAKIYAMNNIKN